MNELGTSPRDPPLLRVRLGAEGFGKHLGGVRRVSFELRAALLRLGVEVTVTLPDPDRMAGLDRWFLSAPGRTYRQLVDMAGIVRRHQRSISHAIYYDPAMLLSRDPLVVTVHDMIHERYGGPRRFLKTLKRAAVDRADAVVAVSAATATDLRELYPNAPDVSVVHNGVSPAILDTPLGVAPREHLLYVGRRAGYKNFDLLLEALRISPDLRALPLVLVGGGPLTASERTMLDGLAANHRLQHFDQLPEDRLLDCYDRALVTVVPSKIEGFGLPVLEAMARCSPVACSSVPSFIEIANDHACFFDPSSAEHLCAAVERAGSLSPSQLTAGRTHAQAFTWERAAAGYVSIYEQLL